MNENFLPNVPTLPPTPPAGPPPAPPNRCSLCGRDNLPGSKFCAGCGSQFGMQANGPAARPSARAGVKRPAAAHAHSRSAIVALILVVLLIAGAVAGGLIFFRQTPSANLPVTAAELRSSVGRAEGYLNSDGRALAKGKNEGASIYSVEASLDESAATITGKERVLFTNRTGTNLTLVVFRVYPNGDDIRGSSLTPVKMVDAEVDGKRANAQLNGSLLNFYLPESLAAGKSALLSFSFSEQLPTIDTGVTGLLGQASGTGGYGIYGHSKNVFDLGYFFPLVAQYENGAWETREVPPFGDVADFDCSYFTVAVDVPGDFVVAATGVPLKEKTGGGRKVATFEAGPSRDFSAQASPDYKVATKKAGKSLISAYYLGTDEKSGRKTLEYAADAMKQFNDHIGPYPYTRFNVCEAPLTGGAAGMEFTGQILLGQLFYGNLGLDTGGLPENLQDLGQEGGNLQDLLGTLTGGLLGNMLEFVTAHEVCHQWWGMTVGSDSIAHPWQDESLTNYCTILYFRWQHGEETAQKELQTEILMQYSSAALMGGTDAIADQPVHAFDSQEQYIMAVYAKGALFFGEVEKQIGAAAFEKSLQSYYTRFAFTNAAPENLLGSFEANAQNPTVVASLFQHWMKETHGSEDVAGANSSFGTLQDLLDQFLNDGGTDLGPLQDMLEQFLDSGELPLPDSSSPLPLPIPETTPQAI